MRNFPVEGDVEEPVMPTDVAGQPVAESSELEEERKCRRGRERTGDSLRASGTTGQARLR